MIYINEKHVCYILKLKRHTSPTPNAFTSLLKCGKANHAILPIPHLNKTLVTEHLLINSAVWGPRAGMQAPLEAGKGNEADSPRGLEKEPAPPLAQWDHFGLLISGTVK